MFDYQEILDRWDDYPKLRMYYDYPDESGWALQLDDTHALIANVPVTGGLMCRDIVALERHEDELPRLVDVVQRYFASQWSVTYLAEDDAREPAASQAAYTTLRLACEAAGCVTEGMSVGWAIVNAPEGVDLRTLLAPLGIGGDQLTLYTPGAA